MKTFAEWKKIKDKFDETSRKYFSSLLELEQELCQTCEEKDCAIRANLVEDLSSVLKADLPTILRILQRTIDHILEELALTSLVLLEDKKYTC